jgi:hypothetical protein
MPIFTLRNKQISEVKRTYFEVEGIQERIDLQFALRDRIDAISPDTLVIAEEFSDWTEGNRRIDLLGIDKNANLVVIELKRDQTGVHMELQAIRYAAMVSTMTFEKAARAFQDYLDKRKIDKNAEEELLEFLGWSDPLDEQFAVDVQIVLASGNFSKELTTTVMWLNERNLNIRCVRLQPYKLGEEILINVEQIIPLPEAEYYLVKVREQAEAQRAVAGNFSDLPLIEEMRERCKNAGFNRRPQLPTRRHVQEWINELGKGENLKEHVNGHIRYWILQRENPSLTHEELVEKLSNEH